MNGDQPGPGEPGHVHSRSVCGLPSGDEPPRPVAQVSVSASALGLSVGMYMDPCLNKLAFAAALEGAAASLRDGSYIQDPTYCGHQPGTCSCNDGSPS